MLLPDSHTRKSLALITCGVAWLLAAVPLEAASTWKAGVARVDITPTESIWMAGYAARTKPSEGVLHPIHAKALAIEDESGTVSVLVTADLGGFRDVVGDRIAAQAAKRYRLPRERLVLNALHTHSGPITRVRRYPSYKLDREHIEAINRYQPKLIDMSTYASIFNKPKSAPEPQNAEDAEPKPTQGKKGETPAASPEP